jgi:hypothetical protein
MFRRLKQARSAVALLNPETVRARAERPITIGLVASDPTAYAEMEDFLLPSDVSQDERAVLLERISRADTATAAGQYDLILSQQGIPAPRGAFVFDRSAPALTIDEILRSDDELALPLARTLPVFRKPMVDRLVKVVARENAMFALTTALPNVIPSFLELPWAFGEFASDTAFITMNQVRMAFVVAAACGRDIGFSEQKPEVLSIIAGAFGWRAIAREIAGKIPLGGGLISKAAIAYAGTFVIGKGLEHFNNAGALPTRRERNGMYAAAYEEGRAVAEGLRRELPSA